MNNFGRTAALLAQFIVLCVSASCTTGGRHKVVESISDLDGLPVSVLGGTVQDMALTNEHPKVNVLRCDTDVDVYTMVNTGKAVASLQSSVSWMMAGKCYPDIVAVGEPVRPVPIGFGLRKDSCEMLGRFNSFLGPYLAQNDMDALFARWADEADPCRMPSPADYDCSAGHIRFAVFASIPPFNFYKNGEVSGIEPEIMARFAISEHKSWEFIDVSFSGLIPYIQSGKADMCASIMCITEERQKSISFSDPYLYESSVLLVNRKYAPEGLTEASSDHGQGLWKSTVESLRKNLIVENRYKLILKGLESTIIIALLSALFGTLLGILLCFTWMHRNPFLSRATNLYIKFMHRMPQLVLLMVMFYIVFGKSSIDGLWVAVISFSMCFGAYTGVVFRSAVESIDKGQSEAALSMGFSKFKAFWHIILPQAVQRALPVYEGEFIGLVKETSIVGYIAVFDLTKAGDVIRSRTYEAFFPLILVTVIYFAVIWALTRILRFVEVRTRPTRKKYSK